MPGQINNESTENQNLSIFFHRWAQRFGIMDRWGMTSSYFYTEEVARQSDVIVGGSGFGNHHDFNDGDW